MRHCLSFRSDIALSKAWWASLTDVQRQKLLVPQEPGSMPFPRIFCSHLERSLDEKVLKAQWLWRTKFDCVLSRSALECLYFSQTKNQGRITERHETWRKGKKATRRRWRGRRGWGRTRGRRRGVQGTQYSRDHHAGPFCKLSRNQEKHRSRDHRYAARRCQAGQSNATEEPAHKQDRFFLRGRSKAADSPDVAHGMGKWGNQGQQGEA